MDQAIIFRQIQRCQQGVARVPCVPCRTRVEKALILHSIHVRILRSHIELEVVAAVIAVLVFMLMVHIPMVATVPSYSRAFSSLSGRRVDLIALWRPVKRS